MSEETGRAKAAAMGDQIMSSFLEDSTAASLAGEMDVLRTVSCLVGGSVSGLPTPCLLVDVDVVKRNCARMAKKARDAGVKLRPHVKTHKTAEIAEWQVEEENGRAGIVASTLAEVRFFMANGYSDITYGVPISEAKLGQVYELGRNGNSVTVFVDSEIQIDAIERFFSTKSRKLPAFLKIDSGYHRAGVDIAGQHDLAITIAKRMQESESIEFRGIYSHSGHAYDGKAQEINAHECAAAKAFAEELRSKGITVENVSVGGTPTCSCCDTFEGVTEIHPGNYVFYDRQQQAVGACTEEDIGATVLTRILGHYRTSGHMLCDAGALAMSKDRTPQDSAFGKALGAELYLHSCSQEVGKLVGPHGTEPDWEAYPVGTLLRVLPNHSCLTAALHPTYYLVQGQAVVGVCKPCRGW